MPVRDPALPHQIVMQFKGGGQRIMVSCNCLATTNRTASGPACVPIEIRSRWESDEAMGAYRQWHEQRGIEL